MFYLKAMTKAMLNCYFMVTKMVLSVDEMISMALQANYGKGDIQNPTPEELESITQGHAEFVEEMKALGKIQ